MNSGSNRLDLKALGDLLEQERAAVLHGRFKEIASFLKEKERLIHKLGSNDTLEAAQIAECREKLIRNKLLLESAADGIRSVSSRMEEFTKIKSGLDVYDATGKVQRFGSRQKSRLEKRA